MQRDFSPVNQRNIYDPWGAPGGGAPIRGFDGQIQTRTAGKVASDSSVSIQVVGGGINYNLLKSLSKISAKTERRFVKNEVKCNGKELSFPLHSSLGNGAKLTPKRRSVFSLIFIVNCFSKFNLVRVVIRKLDRKPWELISCLFHCRQSHQQARGTYLSLNRSIFRLYVSLQLTQEWLISGFN